MNSNSLSLTGVAALLGAGMLAMAGVPSAAQSPAAVDGGTLFKQRCQSCHSVDPAKPAVLGPNLAGVVGRKAGATQFRYSPALKASGLTWSKAALDKFITAPAQLVPGTRMIIKVANPAERAAIIDFLARSH